MTTILDNHELVSFDGRETRARGDVIAPLTFMVPPDGPNAEKPSFESQAYTGGAPRYRFETEQRAVRIADMRRAAADFTLDRHGFALRTVPTAVADLYADEAVAGPYGREITRLLKRELGADDVFIFDATRRSDDGGGAANPDGQRAPATRIHVDYTEASAPRRVRDVIGYANYDRLIAAGARIVQINVWRPITGPVRRAPLALADASSIPAGDLIATDQIFPDRVGEIYHLAYDPAHRWYYAPEMTRDEVLLIKGWDSLNDGRARFTPHSAFTLPNQDPAAPARESLEIRTFAVIR